MSAKPVSCMPFELQSKCSQYPTLKGGALNALSSGVAVLDTPSVSYRFVAIEDSRMEDVAEETDGKQEQESKQS